MIADTFSPRVAALALDAGAAAINDIGGGEPEMLELVAERRCGYVLMHIEGPPRVDRPAPRYDDVVDHLLGLVRRAAGAGRGARGRSPSGSRSTRGSTSTSPPTTISRSCAASGELRELGRPLFVALSRKDFLGAVAAGSWERRLEPTERGPATMAAAALAVAAGAEVLRLHDAEALDAMRTAAAIAGRRVPDDEPRRRSAARLGAAARGGRPRRAPRHDQRRAGARAAHGRGPRRPLRLARGGAAGGPGSPSSTRTRSRRWRPPGRAT